MVSYIASTNLCFRSGCRLTGESELGSGVQLSEGARERQRTARENAEGVQSALSLRLINFSASLPRPELRLSPCAKQREREWLPTLLKE